MTAVRRVTSPTCISFSLIPWYPLTSFSSTFSGFFPVRRYVAVLRAASMTPPVFPKITPAPEASPRGESKGISDKEMKSTPSSFAQSASSLVVIT